MKAIIQMFVMTMCLAIIGQSFLQAHEKNQDLHAQIIILKN